MTNAERIAEIEKDLWKFEVTPPLGFSIIAEDARFMLDRIAKLERLAEAVRGIMARESDWYCAGGPEELRAVLGCALAACEEENAV